MNKRPALLLRSLTSLAVVMTLALPASSTRAESAPEIPDATVAKLQAAIRDALPAGWSVSYEKETQWLEVKRTEPLPVLSAAPNQPPGQEPERREYAVAFRIRKLVPPSEYAQQYSTNGRLELRARTLYDVLVKRRVSQKFDSFAPSTEEDKALVEEYEKVKAALYKLPDFSYDDISLDWAYNDPKKPISIPADAAQERECHGVLAQVTKLLSKYEPPQRRWKLTSWE